MRVDESRNDQTARTRLRRLIGQDGADGAVHILKRGIREELLAGEQARRELRFAHGVFRSQFGV
ncbi:hypothetical protein [Bosea sp. WAO]|uniref:hypothetical protein n=1 Tax=Bosea sp. WAO TaxID=406341 RepID=UPI0020C00612|nr:hypothetical protein [Bosea sp. WAO]